MFDMTRQKTINGKNVVIYLLPASQGIVIAKRLLEIFLPAFGTAIESSKYESGMDFQEVAASVAANLPALDESIIKKLLKGCSVDLKDVGTDFDNYFMGNYGELISILEFAVTENFSSFFTGTDLLSKFQVMTANQAEAQPSPE